MKFNPAFAHNWDTAKQGTPDVVFMGWEGHPEGGPDAAIERAGSKDRALGYPMSNQHDTKTTTTKRKSLADLTPEERNLIELRGARGGSLPSRR